MQGSAKSGVQPRDAETIIEQVSALLAARKLIEDDDSGDEPRRQEHRERQADGLIKLAAMLAAEICGPIVQNIALRTAFSNDLDPLLLMAHRIRLALPLIDNGDDQHAQNVVDELYAVASGDAPRLCARRAAGPNSSKPLNSFRLSMLRMEALKWERYLRGRGEPAYKAQSRVQDAFHTTWDTIRKTWRSACEDVFGKDAVSKMLEDAYEFGQIADPTQLDLWMCNLQHGTVELAGKAHQEELMR